MLSPSTSPSDTRRSTCSTCLRPQRACICRWITPVENTVEVLILQHPLETGEAKGSARLLHLSLDRSRIEIGETFSETALQALLHSPFEDGTDGPPSATARQPVLLYPTDENTAPATDAILQDPERIRLVVLDGTWRKTRKMLHLNPQLQVLPRLPLFDPPPSHYLIRKAHRADQLSTLEATCHALMHLDHDVTKYTPLLHAFDGFVAQQQTWIPPSRRR